MRVVQKRLYKRVYKSFLSYLRKSKMDPFGQYVISEELGMELLKKYKLKFIDLRVGMEKDMNYTYLNKVWTPLGVNS